MVRIQLCIDISVTRKMKAQNVPSNRVITAFPQVSIYLCIDMSATRKMKGQVKLEFLKFRILEILNFHQ